MDESALNATNSPEPGFWLPTAAPSGNALDFASPAVPPEPALRLSVAQYQRMIDHGIIADNAPVELLEGWLIQKMGKNRPHALCKHYLRTLLERLIPAGFHVEEQESVTTADSQPEPDVSVVRGAMDDYPALPPPASALPLVVEISDSTVHRDRKLKRRIYGRAGIPVYWIVDLVDRQVEAYTQPTGPAQEPGYAACQVYDAEAAVPVVIDGREVGRIAAKEILP
jgi:Uma2 family endonuclease